MKFRTTLLFGTLILVFGIVGAMVVGISEVVDQAAQRDLRASLDRSIRAFGDVWQFRQSLHRAEARRIADEPRLRAAVATEDITHETLLGVAQDIRGTLDADVFLLVNSEGVLLADVTHPEEQGHSLANLPVVRNALAHGDESGVWVDERSGYQVQGQRIAFGETVVGAVVVGYRIDDELADAMERQTGSAAVVTFEDRILANSLREQASDVDTRRLRALGDNIHRMPAEVSMGGVRYLATETKVADLGGSNGDLRIYALSSLDDALAPSNQLKLIVYVIAALALVAAAALATFLARRLAHPLDELVRFSGMIARGDLEARASAGGLRETRALGDAMNRMVSELAQSRIDMAAKERLEKEMELASQIQTSILPRKLDAPNLEIAATMVPASEVGGDYYDVLPVKGSACWIGIGDVSGHGMPAGLVMLMVQTAINTLASQDFAHGPAELLVRVNDLVFANVRGRLRTQEHVTICVLRHDGVGRFVYAGAHESILVYRANEGRCEIVETEGTWLGVFPDVRNAMVANTLELSQGDVMILFTDGVTEVENQSGEMFGQERLCAAIEGYASITSVSAEAIRDHVLQASRDWMVEQRDDMTLVVIRYLGDGSAGRG